MFGNMGIIEKIFNCNYYDEKEEEVFCLKCGIKLKNRYYGQSYPAYPCNGNNDTVYLCDQHKIDADFFEYRKKGGLGGPMAYKKVEVSWRD